MRATGKIELKHAFVLRASDVKKIWSILSESMESVRVVAHCTDNLEREFKSAEELIAYENPRSRAVRSLRFSARSKDLNSSASLLFGGTFFSQIDLSVEGSEPMVLSIRDRVGELLDGMRSWYSVISRIDFFHVVIGMLVLIIITLQGMSGSDAAKRTLTLSQAVKVTAVVCAFFGLFAGVGFLLNKIRDRFFPTAVFALGQGEDRYKFDDKIRWAVIVSFVVSVFSSLVVAFFLPAA